MEFRFRAGDRRPRNPSPALFSGPCDQRFPPQAGPFHGDLSPPPAFDWEAAAWRERLIREEVERRLIRVEVERRLIRVEVERRLIEEEVRRELAVATARFHGGFGPVPFVGPDGPLVPPQTPGTFFGHEGPLLPLPPAMFFGHDGPLLPPVPLPLMPVDMQQNCPPPASFAEWERVDRSVGFEQSVLVKRPLPPPKRKHKLELCEIKPPKRKHKLKQCEIKPPKPMRKLKLSGIEPSKSSEIHSPETKVSGVKRKADVISATTEPTELVSETTEPTELQNEVSATTEPKEVQNAARHWSCALCQVTANTKADLKQHLRGRRHLAKLVHSGSITLIDDDKSGLEEITGNDNGAGPSDDAPREIHVLINGAIHEVVYKNGLLTSTTIKPTELQNAISETIEPAKVQNVTFATTEPTEVQNAARYSSFAPSQVGATSKVNLKKYRKGRRHLKRKLHSYGLSAVASGAGPSDAPKKIHILVDGAMHEVVQQGGFVRCERCGVKCVNAGLMADHLRGKKHSLLNKVWRAIKDVRMKNKSKQDSAASC